MGGVIKALSLGSLSVTNVTVTLVTIASTYNAANEGSFFYMDNSDSIPLIITISDSNINCKGTSSLSSTSYFSMTPGLTFSSPDYYSVFYVYKTT